MHTSLASGSDLGGDDLVLDLGDDLVLDLGEGLVLDRGVPGVAGSLTTP